MREPRDTDFFIPVPDLGTFRYGRRTYGDRLKIRAAFLRLTAEFDDSDPDLAMYAAIVATHSVLCVEAPDGWEDIAEVDLTAPGDPDAKVFELFGLLREKEEAFAKGAEKSGEATGEGAL